MKEITNESDGVIVQGIANSLGRSVIEATSERDNYVIFSIFTVIDGASSGKVLGLLNRIFITL